MIELLALPVAGLCDRVRGGYPEGKRPKWLKYLCMTLIGPCLCIQVTHDPWAVGLSVLAGHVMWRQDNGWRGRWVQNEMAILKAMRWGAIASVPFLLLAYFDLRLLLMLPAFCIGTVLAILVAIRLPSTGWLQLRHGWPWSELIELPIIGMTAAAGVMML